MLNRSRVGRSIDVQRLAQAVRGPGIDTRTWVSLAVALGESAVDEDHGVFVDVQLVPSGEEYTARMAPGYAGNGFGLYHRIHEGDELKVEAPSGDPAQGVIVSSILWSAADKPPTEVKDNPEDFVLVVEKDKNLKIFTAGGGNVEMTSESTVGLITDSVRLGELAASEQLLLGTTYRGQEGTMNGVLGPNFTADGVSWTAVAAAFAAASTEITTIFAALYPLTATYLTALGTAATALATTAAGNGTAVSAFESAAATYLSNVSKTK
jgi:hypothetical protein